MWPAGDVLIKFLTKNSENMKNTKILGMFVCYQCVIGHEVEHVLSF